MIFALPMPSPLSPLVAAACVALGGAAGALGRWGVGMWTVQAWPNARWPFATIAVNLVGSFAIGILAPLLLRHEAMRLLVVTGLLGGFTTFSAFSLDTLALAQAGRWGAAALVAGLSVGGGVALCALGWRVATALGASYSMAHGASKPSRKKARWTGSARVQYAHAWPPGRSA